MSQQTLDDLSISSFKVDGIEQLSAAVDFGIINVVSINGKAFVTNLIDALNGLEIPYFSFKPSERDYALKTDLRFFKIKRPSCQTFEIIISAEAEVYRYRDYDMASKWFDADWDGFGYDADEITEPLGCVETVEY